MSEQRTLSDKPCGATADWILGYLANECSLDMGCVSPADFLAIVNAIHNHELDQLATVRTALERCRTVLGNMALENEGAIFKRWPINHEPLRNDARNLLPVVDAALSSALREGEK